VVRKISGDDMTCRCGSGGCPHGSFFQKGDAMFWGFLLLTGLAFVFVQLGALSVWVVVLKLGLMMALLVLAIMGIVLLWRVVFSIRTLKRLDQNNK